MGTGLTTGPFVVLPGMPLTLQDPRQGVNSTSVQVQNNSDLAVSVLSGADTWTITSNQSSTIPLSGGGAALTVTPGTVGTGGIVTAVWLLDASDQSAPQPDGQLTSNSLKKDILIAPGTDVVAVINQVPPEFPVPPFTQDVAIAADTVLIVAQLTFISASNIPNATLTFTMTGDTTGTVYAQGIYNAGEFTPDGAVNTISAQVSGANETGVTFEVALSGPDDCSYDGFLDVVAYELVTGGGSFVPYASLTGAGETTTPGALTQAGDLEVTGNLVVDNNVDLNGPEVVVGSPGGVLTFFGAGPPGTQATITGALTSVTDANAKAVLTSIVAALASEYGLVINGTT